MGDVIMLRPFIMARLNEKLPNRIREWRERRNLSMAELASRTGISYPHMGKLENGERRLYVDTARVIADALDVTVGDILSKEINPFNPTERERQLLQMLREGGEPMLKAMEAVATIQFDLVLKSREAEQADRGETNDMQSA